MNARYDVVVIGARCAGASTALLLARAGLRVLAVDRGSEGSDTLSTHALMRGGVLQLHRWGVLPEIVAAGTPAVRATTFHYGEEAVEIAIQPKHGVDALYGPRRTVLDAALVRAARRAGAEIAHRTSLVSLLRDARGRVCGAVLDRGDGARTPVRADLVIGADGIGSRVARLAGAETVLSGRHASGIVYGYFEGLAPQGFHWHYRPGASVGVIPTNEGRMCVFAATPSERLRAGLGAPIESLHAQLLGEAAPALAALLRGARPQGGFHTFPGQPGFLRRAWGPGWALVGDAGFFRDPLTAHGITDALRDAELLARAVTAGGARGFADYEESRDALARDMLLVSDAIASFTWDLDRVKELHHDLSRGMKAEVEMLAAGQGAELPRPAGAAAGLGGCCPLQRLPRP